MPQRFKIGDLPPAEYRGFHCALTQDQTSGLQTRLTAIDYSGESEVFVTKCHVFTRLEPSIPFRVRRVTAAPGHTIAEYTGWQLDTLLDDINEKMTQWSAVAPAVRSAALRFEAQLAAAPAACFEFRAPVRELESQVEHYCFKIISILDVYARVGRVFNRRCPEKFGQQIASTHKSQVWDQVYQDVLMSCDAMVELRDYRNALGHEISLKLRPSKQSGVWKAVLVEVYHAREGLLLCPFLDELQSDLMRYVDFMDRHFAAKAEGLSEFAFDNLL